jgi:hypothetical protein
MTEITQWLNSAGDYDAGVRIFLKYSDDPVLTALFTLEEETDFKRKRLVQALKALLNPATARSATVPRDPVIKAAMPKSVPGTMAHSGWPNPITDPVMRALWDQWRPKYAELMSLQQRLYEVALQGEKGDSNKKLEACQMAHRIMDLDDECDEIYAERDHYLQRGHLPGNSQPVEPVGDPVRWATELQNCQRYVRNYRLKITKDPLNKRVPIWQEKIKDWEQDIIRYKKLLKLD